MGQLLQLIPRPVFDHLVDRLGWQGPKPRKFTYWSHLAAMLFGQWSSRKSLRDLVFSLNRHARKFYHLGLALVKRSTLADANEPRPAVIFEKTYYKLYERLAQEMEPQARQAPRIKISDATTIDLCASVFPWAKFRSGKGAVKLHTVLTGQLPQCVIVTEGKTPDQKAVQDLRVEAGDLLIFDRAYLDYAWLFRLHQGGVWFVTRFKRNSCYGSEPGAGVRETRPGLWLSSGGSAHRPGPARPRFGSGPPRKPARTMFFSPTART